MELDFTALDNIAVQLAKEDFSEPITYTEGSNALQPETPARSENRAPQKTYNYKLDKEAQERADIRKMYHAYQENIRQAGNLRTEILKGVQHKEDPVALLLKAVQCIGLMTGDTVIYNQCKADAVQAYGYTPEDKGTA